MFSLSVFRSGFRQLSVINGYEKHAACLGCVVELEQVKVRNVQLVGNDAWMMMLEGESEKQVHISAD